MKAFNYNPDANVTEETVFHFLYGCTDETALNSMFDNTNNPKNVFMDVMVNM
ncbi:MAG: hypothetical protein CM15mP23_04860 [Cryomorphaceae bacterium]|nr:MAG: hypothetical protein CM15mP23_04860 [Cryomorphaceae bacterium]